MNFPKLAERIVVTHWWTWLFCLGSLFLYEIQAGQSHREKMRLQRKAEELTRQIESLSESCAMLTLQTESFSDPRYGELCLREELGMKRRPQIKVVFK